MFVCGLPGHLPEQIYFKFTFALIVGKDIQKH